jgi:hypothetical protein
MRALKRWKNSSVGSWGGKVKFVGDKRDAFGDAQIRIRKKERFIAKSRWKTVLHFEDFAENDGFVFSVKSWADENLSGYSTT